MRGKAILCFYAVMLLQMMSWGCVESRLFAANDVHGSPLPGSETVAQQSPQSLPAFMSSKEGFSGVGEMSEEESYYYEGVKKKIGSMPPRCEDKCYGCTPCEAIQVPTTTSRVGVQYANYEPEDWKCKCGPAFYSP